MSEFQLRDALISAEFSGRVADVFAGLGSGELKVDKDDVKRLSETRPNFDKQQMERSGHFKNKPKMNEIRDEEIIEFKKPRMDKKNFGRGERRTRGGKIPGFKRNPAGYTKYSLADVPELSERSNSAAAFDFLRKLKEGKEESEEIPADLTQKIVFKKRGSKNNIVKSGERSADEKNTVEENSTQTKEQKVKSSKSKSKSKQLTLSHLEDEEDE